MMLLTGCGKKGPEDYRYPLAVGIGQSFLTGQMEVIFSMPKNQVEAVSVPSLLQANQTLDATTEQSTDLNHTKVFIVERDLLLKEEDKESMITLKVLKKDLLLWPRKLSLI